MASPTAMKGVALFFIFVQLFHLNTDNVYAQTIKGTKTMDLTLLLDSTIDYHLWGLYKSCFEQIIKGLSFDSDRVRVAVISVQGEGAIMELRMNHDDASSKEGVLRIIKGITNRAGQGLFISNAFTLAQTAKQYWGGRPHAPHVVIAAFHKAGIRPTSEVQAAASALTSKKARILTIGLDEVNQALMRTIATTANNKKYYRYFSTVTDMCNAAGSITELLYDMTPVDDGSTGTDAPHVDPTYSHIATGITTKDKTPGDAGFAGTEIPTVKPTDGYVGTGITTRGITATTTATTTTKATTEMPMTCITKPCRRGLNNCPASGDDENIVMCAEPTDVCARYCFPAAPKPSLGSNFQNTKYKNCLAAPQKASTVYVPNRLSVDVQVVCPNRGPYTGDTVVHIWGLNLNIQNLKIYFTYSTAKTECLILDKSSTFIQCRTQSVAQESSVLRNRPLSLQLYQGTKRLHNENSIFTFKQPPSITSVSPKQIPLEGGRPLTMKGFNLNNVAEVIYEVRVAYRPQVSGRFAETVFMFASLCGPSNSLGTQIICPSPTMELPDYVTDPSKIGSLTITHGQGDYVKSVFYRIVEYARRRRRATTDGKLSSDQLAMYGRMVLGGMRYQNRQLDQVELFKGPEILHFEGEDRTYGFFPDWPDNEKYIEIPGRYLDAAANISDYKVMIGGSVDCPVHEVTSTVLRCLAPAMEPKPLLTQDVQIHPIIRVQFFDKIEYPGFVSYKGVWDNNVFKYGLIAAILILILIILIIVFVVIFRRLRSNAPRKESSNHYNQSHSIRSGSNSYKPDFIVPQASETFHKEKRQKVAKPVKVKEPKPKKMKVEKGRRTRGKLPFHEEETPMSTLKANNLDQQVAPPPSPPPPPEIVPMAVPLANVPPAPRPPSIVSDHSVRSYGSRSSKRESLISTRSIRSALLDDMDDSTKAKVLAALVKPELVDRYDEISRGNRGVIYSGRFTQQDDGTEQAVIIKTFREKDTPKTDKVRFIREAIMLRDFNHRYLHATIAMVIQEEVPFAVSPQMENGDLKQFLHKIRATHRNEIALGQQLGFARDIARGMAYLSERTFVHKDLAARTCMVDKRLTAKVSDVALSRDIYDIDYYWVDKLNASLPFKWMALEGLERFIFSTKTDVWSFGVLLWEIMTLGGTPYTDVDNSDLKRHLKRGNRMHQPDHTPDSVFSIMDACWQTNPDKRPRFVAIVDTLDELLAENEEITIMGGDRGAERQSTSGNDVFMM